MALKKNTQKMHLLTEKKLYMTIKIIIKSTPNILTGKYTKSL